MHIHFLNMLNSYSLCSLPHSRIKQHASCTNVPINSTKQSGRPQDAVRKPRLSCISTHNISLHISSSNSSLSKTKALIPSKSRVKEIRSSTSTRDLSES